MSVLPLRFLNILIVLLLMVSLSPAPARAASAAEIDTLMPWFMPPEFASPKLSPRGDFLAFILCDGKDYAIGIFDLATRKLSVASTAGKMRPLGLWWKGPRRLLAHLVTEDGRSAIHSAFDLDGGNPERLLHLTERRGRIIDAQADDPDHVLLVHGGTLHVGMQSSSFQPGEVVRFNIHDGTMQTVGGELHQVQSWYLDRDLAIRGAYRRLSDGARIVNWRNSGTGPWQAVKIAPEDPGFRPVGFDADPRYLWAWDFRTSGRATLSRFDTQAGELAAGVVARDGLEPTGVLMLGNSREPVAAVYPQTTPVRIEPLNESWRPVIERMQKFFAGYTIGIVDKVAAGTLWIVSAGSSRYPGGYFLFDSQTGEATLIASAFNPALKEDMFVTATPVAVPSRHGFTIRGRVWLPKGVRNPPVIVQCAEALPTCRRTMNSIPTPKPMCATATPSPSSTAAAPRATAGTSRFFFKDRRPRSCKRTWRMASAAWRLRGWWTTSGRCSLATGSAGRSP